ncbi:MAG: CoA-binding protein [Myxococcota bacterium]
MHQAALEMHANPPCGDIRRLLQNARTVAVVGCSVKPFRQSHVVSKAMHRRGLRMIPVNPTYEGDSLWGEQVFARLSDIREPIDIVNVYRRSEFTPDVARDAVSAGAKALWLQLGVKNEEAAAIASEAGLLVVQDLCLAVAHTMLIE